MRIAVSLGPVRVESATTLFCRALRENYWYRVLLPARSHDRRVIRKIGDYSRARKDVNTKTALRTANDQMTRAASTNRVTLQALVREIGRVSAISTMSPSLY